MGLYDTARELLMRISPSAVFRPQPATDWQGDFALPDPVAKYFSEFGPVDLRIPAHGNPYYLPSLAGLWQHQTGYRTNVFTGERVPDWDDNWLVIADQGGDPVIFCRDSGIVLHAFHGEGVWAPTRMFDSLVEMVTTLAIIGDIVAAAGAGLTDADSLILPRYREQARTRLSDSLDSETKADEIVALLGWS